MRSRQLLRCGLPVKMTHGPFTILALTRWREHVLQVTCEGIKEACPGQGEMPASQEVEITDGRRTDECLFARGDPQFRRPCWP